MRKLLRILTLHSVSDLFKYKSFFLLVFFILAADQILPRFIHVPEKGFDIPSMLHLSSQAAQFVFSQMPSKIVQWLLTPRVAMIVAGLFLMKQVISLWPSSDMRRMHRQERGRFGLLEALAVLRWHQVAWDAIAVGLVCGFVLIWITIAYLIGYVCWRFTALPLALLLTATVAVLALPIGMAGFSYSSKLAVINQGGFGVRFRLFLRLFSDKRLFWTSWVFFACRVGLELVFVAAIPAGAILLIENFWLRMAVATLSATPVYSYLKMASFKFFLQAYGGYDLVRQEYATYYAALDD